MYLLSIIPLSRTAPPEPLSYRSSKEMLPGALVTVPLRRSMVAGVVIDCIPAREAKAELKTASFSVLKSANASGGTLPEAYVTAAHAVAQYHATTFGAVLSALFVPVQQSLELQLHALPDSRFYVEHCESATQARMAQYRSRIEARESGALLLVVPTEAEARSFAAAFKSFAPVVLSGTVPEKKRVALFEKAYDADQLVITTPSFSWIPIRNLSEIVIERMSAGGYQLPKRPYIDVRQALTELARARSVPITYGDYPLPIEYREHPDAPLQEMSTGAIALFDARKAHEEAGTWKAIPDALRKEIVAVQETGGVTVLLTVRRGYAPVVICHDCGTTVTDAFGRALSLATEKGERVLRSVDGKSIEPAHAFCKVCNSWDLVPLGVGSERAEEEMLQAFPEAHIVRADQDLTPTKLRTAIKIACATPGAIIVGTELMLPLLSTSAPITLGVVVSADSLLALPFWRARERFIRVGLMLAERSERTIVSTRHPEDAALTALTNPTTSAFWSEESSLRTILAYPPYGTLVILQSEGSRARVEEMQQYIIQLCAPLLVTHMTPRALSATMVRGTSILQLPEGEWPNEELAERLATLPPFVRIQINSETLW